jgi:hypothetical protein
MKKLKLKIGFIAIVIAANVISCKNVSSIESVTQTDNSSISKYTPGFTVLALRSDLSGRSELSASFNVTSGVGVFSPITNSVTGLPMTNVTGIATRSNNWSTVNPFIYATTSAGSNYPGCLLRINSNTKVAIVLGATVKAGTVNPIYLQDIERYSASGSGANSIYYAIEIGTANIYQSTPTGINPPLAWVPATSSFPSVTPFINPSIDELDLVLTGLDLVGENLIVYSNQKLSASPYTGIGFGALLYQSSVSTVGPNLTFSSKSALNIVYTPSSSNEDAAILVSKTPISSTGIAPLLITPSLSTNCFSNINPLWYISAAAMQTFTGISSTSTGGVYHMLDYTYAQ